MPTAPRCAIHARESAVDTCRGCGLFLSAAAAVPREAPRCPRCSASGHPIPWEDTSLPSGARFGRTLKALVKADAFFAAAPWVGGLRQPAVFAVLAATIGALAKTIYGLLSGLVIGGSLNLALDTLRPTARAVGGRAATDLLDLVPQLMKVMGPAMAQMQLLELLLTPLSTLLGLFVLAALTHPIARRLGGQGSFEGTFRVLAYASAAQVLQALPMIGGALSTLGGLLLVIAGMRRAHGVSGGKAFVLALWWVPLAALATVLVVLWLASVALSLLAH